MEVGTDLGGEKFITILLVVFMHMLKQHVSRKALRTKLYKDHIDYR